MEIPTGYKEVYADPGYDKVLVLKMAMYGLVQAARQWFKRLSDVLITLGFNPCESDPCLAIFSVAVSPIAMEYLGCEINVAENYSCRWIGQPDLYKNLEKKFDNMIKGQ